VGRSAVVVLNRGAWCPYCNVTLRAYQEDLVPQLAQRDIPLVAISPQKPDGSLSMQEKNELSFTVLSDPGNQVAAALGVLTAPPMMLAPLSASLASSCPRPTPTGPMGYQCRR
jgi:peroxiredoxin